jgi:hypothetical protein
VAQVLRRCGAGPSCSSPKGRAAKRPCHAPRLRRVCAAGPLPCRFRCKSRPRRSAAAGCARGRRRRSGCRLRWARAPLLPAGRHSLYAAVGFGHRHACCAAATAKVGRWLRLAVRRNGTGSAPYVLRASAAGFVLSVRRRPMPVDPTIPCRAGYHAGYHAGQDTIPGGIPSRVGYHAGGSRARFAAWVASCLLCAIWRVTGVLCSLLGSGVGAGKGLDEASQAEGAIPIPIPIEVACQRHIAEAVRKQQSVRDVEFRLHIRAQLKSGLGLGCQLWQPEARGSLNGT